MADGTRSLEVVNEDDDKEQRIILVGDMCQQDENLVTAVQELGIKMYESETGTEHVTEAVEYDCVFVLSDFRGDIFERLQKLEVRIVGPPVLKKCAKEKLPVPYNSRPQYCSSMLGLKVCFTGFKEKSELCHLVNLVHYMGGNVRRDFKATITHLVANGIGGDKYQYAVGMGKPIMNQDWINKLWSERDSIDFNAEDPSVMKYKVPAFYKRCLSFLGFSKEEQSHMEEVTIENGGTFAAVGDEECTHLIVDEAVKELPEDKELPRHVVKGEWFWACVQMEACAAENIYTFRKAETVNNVFTPCTSMPGSKSRKRKRLKENIAQLLSDEELESPLYNKRRSSDMGGIISPNSFLDASNTPDLSEVNLKIDSPLSPAIYASKLTLDDKEPVKISARLQVVKEFLQTEKNYVGILHTLLNTFKAQIEKQDQYNGAILAVQDVKMIFGNIPAIYAIHCSMRDELAEMVDNWHDEQMVGNVITQHSDALVKAYPPFVNFFEDTKERIQKCDKFNPRFHAFLKVCQTKPECGRQTLTELLIRPVQRLPSITLLLNDILKHTSKANPDYATLEKANSVLKEVMTHINEDKRKTESQVEMFDIMKDIENCPATLLSSHRMFVNRVDVIELSDALCERGAPLSLFLFSDCVVICKRRTKVLHSKSPGTLMKTPQKGYKHIELLQLQCVKRVINVLETEECRNAFGLIVKAIGEMKEKLLTFMVDSEDEDKSEFLTSVSKCIANTMCRTDFDNLLISVEADQLQINTTDLGNQTFGKAASRFSKRVSRAFSFNKTPRRLKRAVSHVFSPFVKDSSRDFTPGNLKGKRLASTIDLTEMPEDFVRLNGVKKHIWEDSISLANFYEDSDTVSLGAFSLQNQ